MRRLLPLAVAAGLVTAVAVPVLSGHREAYASVQRYDAGTYVLSRTLVVPDHGSLVGAGAGQTVFRAAAGFTGPLIATAGDLSPTASVHHPGITIRGISVDGGQTASRGIALSAADDLTVSDVEVYGTTSDGIYQRGIQDSPTTEDQTWSDVSVHDCGGWGVYNGLRTRHVSYHDIKVRRCRGGMKIDHSESSADDLQLTDNTGDGLYIRNVFSLTVTGVRATGNTGYGIHAQGLVDSAGSVWVAENNGTGDVWFDGSAPQPEFTYGISRGTVVTDVVAGHSAYVMTNRSAQEPAVTMDAHVAVHLTGLDITSGRQLSF